MKTVSIHQPGYLPWLGFFKKIMYSDVFVFLDDIEYAKRQYHNRNQIRTSQGAHYLSVPVKKKSSDILNKIQLDYSTDWNLNHKKTIEYSYKKAKFFQDYWKFFDELYNKKFEFLIDLNLEIIKFVLKELEIKTKTILSSELDVMEKKSDRNLAICKKLDAEIYLSGFFGKNYLNENDFVKNKIKIEYQNFQHPIYEQLYEPFIPNLSIIDLLFNEGKKTGKILKKAKNF